MIRRDTEDPIETISRYERRKEEYPCYSEVEYRKRDRAHPSLSFNETLDVLIAPDHPCLDESEVDDLLENLGLSFVDLTIARLKMAGGTIRSIVESTGMKKWKVERSIRRIRAAYENRAEGGMLGWQGVYRAETRRQGSKRR